MHVDDDPDLLELSADFLEQEDADLQVTTKTDPQTALDRIRSEAFDCVISDYQMSEMDGVELLRAVREEYPELPFLLFTGKGSEAVASEAISAGVTDYLQKQTGREEYSVLAQQIRNVVERKRAIERFETFLESAPDAIIIVDADGAIEQVNEQAEELFGYDRSTLLSEPIELLIPDRYCEQHIAHREGYIEAPETRPMGADLDLYALHEDGTEIPVDIAISPLHVGGRVEVMAAVRDISKRKWREAQLREREAELERQNERLEDFASVVSHDLRNPLHVASGNLKLAQERCDLDHLERVEKAHERMESLIDDLLTLARDGQSVDSPSPVELDEVAMEAWEYTATEGATIDLDGAATTIMADRSRLKEALENLFHNAAEHGGDAVTVRVTTTDDGFTVSDDGPGIAAAERDRLFESGYSTKESGMGLGLAIVRTVAEAHGWTVTADQSPAGGAAFEFSGIAFE